jgi:hypothetical protein
MIETFDKQTESIQRSESFGADNFGKPRERAQSKAAVNNPFAASGLFSHSKR